jgi:hypothetical protein
LIALLLVAAVWCAGCGSSQGMPEAPPLGTASSSSDSGGSSAAASGGAAGRDIVPAGSGVTAGLAGVPGAAAGGVGAGSSANDAGSGGIAGASANASGASGASTAGAIAAAGNAAAGTGGASGSTASLFPVVKDLSMNGPFAFTQQAEGPDCTIWRPTNLGEGGVRHPVIIWGNGTGGPIFVYAAAFEYWASHGFIVAGANVSDGQGDGVEMLACLDYLHQQDVTDGSPYKGKVDRNHTGASGHSQGGGGALMAGRDPRLTATAPLMPYIAQGFGGFDRASISDQKGAMLLLSGTADTIAPPAMHQQPVFEMTNVPVVWANLMGGDHVAVSLNGLETYREIMLAWYRLQLMGDESFRDRFYGAKCGVCMDGMWSVQRRMIN